MGAPPPPPPRRNGFFAPAAVADYAAAAVHIATPDRDNSNGNALLIRRRPGESLLDFERRRSYVYGQRSRDKKKRELDDLRTQCRQLEDTKAALQREHRRLQACVERAMEVVELW